MNTDIKNISSENVDWTNSIFDVQFIDCFTDETSEYHTKFKSARQAYEFMSNLAKLGHWAISLFLCTNQGNHSVYQLVKFPFDKENALVNTAFKVRKERQELYY